MLVTAILSGLSGYLLSLLGRRISATEDEVVKAWSGHVKTDLGRALRNYCQSAVTVDLLPTATGLNLGSMPVRYRDHSDKFMSYSDLVRLVRLFYQLEYSLDTSPELGAIVLGLLERQLEANDGTKKIGRIERVKRGQRCDVQTMTPVRSGSHVEQPLGFIVYSLEKKVISKAEVLCR